MKIDWHKINLQDGDVLVITVSEMAPGYMIGQLALDTIRTEAARAIKHAGVKASVLIVPPEIKVHVEGPIRDEPEKATKHLLRSVQQVVPEDFPGVEVSADD